MLTYGKGLRQLCAHTGSDCMYVYILILLCMHHICVLILLHMCPHTAMRPHRRARSRLQYLHPSPYMCPHTAMPTQARSFSPSRSTKASSVMQAHPGGDLKFRTIDNVTFIVGGLRIMGVARRAAKVQVSYVCVCVCIYIYIYICQQEFWAW
jgi:hypothetical protein